MLHDSRSPFFRSPGGAVPQGTAVTLSLYAPGFAKAYLRLWDGREHITEMIPGERCFSAQVSRAEPCLLCYYFLLEKQDGQTLYYLNAPDMLGGEGELTAVCDTLRSFCITFYSQDYKTPAWCADAVMYQIFPDRFNASLSAAGRGKSLGRRMHKDWASAPEYRESPGKDYYAADDFYGTYGSLFFIGIVLSVLFICAAVLIIYYKQLCEGYEDQPRFAIMQKVGMTAADIRRSVNSQLLTVFFLPLAGAALHMAFAFPMIRRMLLLFELHNTGLFIATALVSFAVLAVVYTLVYKATSNAYYRIVKGSV